MEPTPVVRAVTYERDEHRCASCGAMVLLQWQHRRATGMGGTSYRPRIEDGLTSCATCNPAYESYLQKLALRFGWKVRSWVKRPEEVPVYVVWERTWYVLLVDSRRVRITAAEAIAMMREVYGDEYKKWEVAA